MAVLKISLICILSGLSIIYFFVLIMFHSDMRVINRKQFNNFNERRTIGVDSEVFLTFEEFMNYVQDDINALRKQSADEMRATTDSMQQIITSLNEKSFDDFLSKEKNFMRLI